MKTRLTHKQRRTWWEAEIKTPTTVTVRWGYLGEGQHGSHTHSTQDAHAYVQRQVEAKTAKGYEPSGLNQD